MSALRESRNAGADAGDTAGPILRVEGLSKTFRASDGRQVPAVKDVSLSVARGEMVVLLGPSGCGKTTLLRCIAGLARPDAGSIEVHGKPAFASSRKLDLPPEKRGLSMMFQSYALWPHMTAFDNVAYPLRQKKVGQKDVQTRVTQALATVGVSNLAKEHPSTMSGGQQQRVALARAIVANSGIILFDEPLSNIDAKVRQELRNELRTMQSDFGIAGLYVTHDQAEAFVLADRIVVLREGLIEQIGTPREIYHQPRSRYVSHFVGVANEVCGSVTRVEADRVHVATAVGDVVGVRPEGTDYAVGDKVAAVFRPEVCLLDAAADGPNTWAGEVKRVTFAGSTIELDVTVNGENLRVWAASTDATAAGSTVSVTVDPAYVRVLPLDDAPTSGGAA